MTLHYVDTSVALRVLQPNQDYGQACTRWWRSAISAPPSLISSQLFKVELRRVGRRRGVPRSDIDAMVDAVALMELDQQLLDAAADTDARVATLDAIHLVSALRLAAFTEHDVVMVTHDAELGAASSAEGLDVHAPGRGHRR